MKLKDKSVIVTGSSQGFGLAAAKAFAQEGANVAICARGQEMLRNAQKELAHCAMGKAKVIAMPADVANPDDVDRLVAYVISELGGVDVLLCNAGVYGPKGPIEELNWSDWAKAIEISRQIIRDFPNSRMSEEIRERMDVLKQKVGQQGS